MLVGSPPNPTYEEACSGQTGHTEVVRVVYDPKLQVSLEALLKLFWESHDPTQGMRQGNDIGTQYRSAIYTLNDEDLAVVEASKMAYQKALEASGRREITTEIKPLDAFYHAEDYHQQYSGEESWWLLRYWRHWRDLSDAGYARARLKCRAACHGKAFAVGQHGLALLNGLTW